MSGQACYQMLWRQECCCACGIAARDRCPERDEPGSRCDGIWGRLRGSTETPRSVTAGCLPVFAWDRIYRGWVNGICGGGWSSDNRVCTSPQVLSPLPQQGYRLQYVYSSNPRLCSLIPGLATLAGPSTLELSSRSNGAFSSLRSRIGFAPTTGPQ